MRICSDAHRGCSSPSDQNFGFTSPSKKFDLISGIPEKIDGPVEWVTYEQKMPLTEELKYFLNHMNGNKPKIANGQHGLEVMKILVKASEQLKS